jgi:PIN domain nuclease of toxin-antitoxin system
LSGFLLDTNALMSIVWESRRIGDQVRRRLERGRRYASDISAVELAIKIRAGRLEPPRAFREDFTAAFLQAVEDAGAERLSLTLDDVSRLAGLPVIHNDPFDAMIIAQAMERGLAVVTSDQRFADYPGLETLEF